MLSYHADMTLANNPFEMGMDRLVDLDMEADFVSREALRKIKENGVTQRFVGLIIDGSAFARSNDENWALKQGETHVGFVTSAIHSPRLKQNIGMAMVQADQSQIGTVFTLSMPNGARQATVASKPFFDPKKGLAAKT